MRQMRDCEASADWMGLYIIQNGTGSDFGYVDAAVNLFLFDLLIVARMIGDMREPMMA